jgi:hypothetical protein
MNVRSYLTAIIFLVGFLHSCGEAASTNTSRYYYDDNDAVEDQKRDPDAMPELPGSGLTGIITYTNASGGPAVSSHFIDIDISRWADRHAEFATVDKDGNITDMLITMEVKQMTFSGCNRTEMDAYFEQPEDTRGELPRMNVTIDYVDGSVKNVQTYPSWWCYYWDVQSLQFGMNFCDVQKIEFGKLPWDE